jgi:phosphoserine phosphatase
MAAAFLVLTAAAGVPDAVADGAGQDLPLAGPPRRLAPSAVELPLARACAAPAIAGIDANVVPTRHRRKRLLVADMDSTIINVECIDELADFAGVKSEVAAITARAMRGEIDFEGALRARVALLKDLPEAVLDRCYAERVRLNPGAETLVRTMARDGARTALISGGFTFFSSRVALAAGFHDNAANVLLAEHGRLSGRVAEPILGQGAKRAALSRLTTELGLDRAETLAIGDGANDLAMIAEAGLGIAFRAKPALRAAAGAVLDHSDLTAVLALQGYENLPDGSWRPAP